MAHPKRLEEYHDGDCKHCKRKAEDADPQVLLRLLSDPLRRAYDLDERVSEHEDTRRVGQRRDKDDKEDGLRSVDLRSRAATYLRSKEEKDRHNRGLLKDLYYKPDKLPLRHDRKASRIWQLGSDYARTVDLIYVRQAQKQQDEKIESPVPLRQVAAKEAHAIGLVATHTRCLRCQE